MPHDASEFFNEIQKSVFGRLSDEIQVFQSLNKRISDWKDVPGADALEIIRKSLMRSVALGMCRLFDPAESHSSITKTNRENLTLKALQVRLKTESKQQDVKKIECFFSSNDDLIEELKHLRNWYFAHVDAEAYVGNDPIPEIPDKDILKLFESLDLLLNQLMSSLLNGVIDHGKSAMSRGDGGVLIKTLQRARQYDKLITDINSDRVGPTELLPRVLDDYGMPDTAANVRQGDFDGFPLWQA